MRRAHCTPRPAAAHAPAAALLARRLPLRGYKRSVPAAALARALALLGAWACSLHALARRLGGPSHETLRRAFHAGRPTLARLDACLPALLRDALPARPPRRPVELAIDLHRRPFYGDRATPGLLGGKAERGTRSFWTYATAVALAPGRRWTVGLARVRSNRMPAVLRALWPQVEASGLRVRRRLLDGGFYCAGVVRWLQRRGVPFVLPVPRKGTAGGTRALYGRPPGLTEYSWRPKGGRRVTVRVAVVRRLLGRRRPRRRKVLVFAYGGLTDGQARRAGAVYRRRFGVESSYRQLGQCLGATCSKRAWWRFLLVGLLLRNLWVSLRYEADAAAGGPAARPTLAEFLAGLAGRLRRGYRPRRRAPTGGPPGSSGGASDAPPR